MQNQTLAQLHTLAEACEFLSISPATGRNWLRLGRLNPTCQKDGVPFFSKSDLEQFSATLSSSDSKQLKSRRNKSRIMGESVYLNYISASSDNRPAVQKIIRLLKESEKPLEESLLLALLRDCAQKLLTASKTPHPCTGLLDALTDAPTFETIRRASPELFTTSYAYLPGEDTLGYLYLSLCDLGNRKSSGSYYTPEWLAKHAVSDAVSFAPDASILDPSCGTGMFLLQIPNSHPLKCLHGCDINPISVLLARCNLAMKYHISTDPELEVISQNIIQADYLSEALVFSGQSFDLILGNPPWGARLTNAQKKEYSSRYLCAKSASVETFDLFLEESICHRMSDSAVLAFVLPEAVLTVKAHQKLRRLLLEQTTLLSLEYLGEVFEGVHCPSILLTVKKAVSDCFCLRAKITEKQRSFFIQSPRQITSDSFSLAMTDSEYSRLHRLLHAKNCTTLKGQADFALGIVTGNNHELIHKRALPGTEPVIKGCDIRKYHIHSHSGYLHFAPEQFQQTAPEEFYRAKEKLFYRFISKQLTFAYDTTGLLSLNSCNIVIPRIPGLSAKYILAVLNSKTAQFIFEKQFRSVKVLRSHLEQIPIPYADRQMQDKIESLVERLLSSDVNSVEYTQTQQILDEIIEKLYETE